MDYAFAPPEINSARMYAGPGSGSLLAAAGSWDALSAELATTAEGYESVLSNLTSFQWRGVAALQERKGRAHLFRVAVTGTRGGAGAETLANLMADAARR